MNGAEGLSIVQNGLPVRAGKPQKVIVVGAGIAGLVTAYELMRAGHDPVILEAKPRVGGRIETVRAPFETRISQALENVAHIHPQIRDEYEAGASKMWHDDEFACGAFALFEPGQTTSLHPHIIASEGRVHFAGEHASLCHRWIQGSIESGLRAAQEIHTATAGA